MNRVLIVEDEARLASFLDESLAVNGYATRVCDDAKSALWLADERDFDLLILDLELPEVDNRELLRRLHRRDRQVPVILLTARGDPADSLQRLDAGAEDCLTKPFSLEELLAQVRARVRPDRTGEQTVLEAGGVSLDLRLRRASAGRGQVALTGRELTLLETLMRHRGQVLSKDQLLYQVWGCEDDAASNVVEVYVGYLRRKLGAEVIETVRGLGYRLRAR